MESCHGCQALMARHHYHMTAISSCSPPAESTAHTISLPSPASTDGTNHLKWGSWPHYSFIICTAASLMGVGAATSQRQACVCIHYFFQFILCILCSPSESERLSVWAAMGDSVQSTLLRAARQRWAFLSMAGKSSWEAANASMRFFTEPNT